MAGLTIFSKEKAPSLFSMSGLGGFEPWPQDTCKMNNLFGGKIVEQLIDHKNHEISCIFIELIEISHLLR